MLGVFLTALAVVLFAVGLWLVFGSPSNPESAEPDREEIFERKERPEAVPLLPPPVQLAKFQLERHLKRVAPVCPECNGSKVQWIDAPGRPGAKLGICPRCACVRFDAAHGQVLAL